MIGVGVFFRMKHVQVDVVVYHIQLSPKDLIDFNFFLSTLASKLIFYCFIDYFYLFVEIFLCSNLSRVSVHWFSHTSMLPNSSKKLSCRINFFVLRQNL